MQYPHACLQLAFKFVPTREQFVASLDTDEGANLEQQVQAFVAAFGPLLKEINDFMVRLEFCASADGIICRIAILFTMCYLVKFVGGPEQFVSPIRRAHFISQIICVQ
jgi:hypothetical protein